MAMESPDEFIEAFLYPAFNVADEIVGCDAEASDGLLLVTLADGSEWYVRVTRA